MKYKIRQILESVPKKVKAKKTLSQITTRRFFVKYPNDLVDKFGNEGAWYESEPQDTMITMLCPTCEKYALVRVDQFQCTQCQNAVGEKN